METQRAREPYSTAVETSRQQFHTLFPISFYILSLHLCLSSTSRVSLKPQSKQDVVIILDGNPVQKKTPNKKTPQLDKLSTVSLDKCHF